MGVHTPSEAAVELLAGAQLLTQSNDGNAAEVCVSAVCVKANQATGADSRDLSCGHQLGRRQVKNPIRLRMVLSVGMFL